MINVVVLGEFNEKKKKSYSRWDVWFEKVLYTHSIFMIIIDREIYSMYNFVLYHIYKCWFMFVVPTYEAKKKEKNKYYKFQRRSNSMWGSKHRSNTIRLALD